MKVHLFYRDRDWSRQECTDLLEQDRFRDLELSWVVKAMSQGDPVLEEAARLALAEPLTDPGEIRYRQDILRDFLDCPELLHGLYDICIRAEEQRKNCWYRLTSPHLSTVYSSGLDLLKIYLQALTELRRALEEAPEACRSEGLSRLRRELLEALSDRYLEQVQQLQGSLGETGGTLISARFGDYLQGVSYVLRKKETGLSRLHWLTAPSYTLADRDMNGAKDLEVRRDRAINQAANALAQAAESLESFVVQLQWELAFYAGGENLFNRMHSLSMPLCFPEIGGKGRSFHHIYDGSLALKTENRVTANDLEAGEKKLFLITGANQGGKTTFLRALGQCQLMAQAGLPVFAEQCSIPVCSRIFTHFTREEDRAMGSGKLDEELDRMSRIADRLCSGSLVLFNESFASTNQREGSELLRQITQALLEEHIAVFSVTHLPDYARSLMDQGDALCLRAERRPDGVRTYRIQPGKPDGTAFGQDLYRKIFLQPEDCPDSGSDE